MQNQVKLDVNTLYGCFCSLSFHFVKTKFSERKPYFPIGNVVVAHNITGAFLALRAIVAKMAWCQNEFDAEHFVLQNVW